MEQILVRNLPVGTNAILRRRADANSSSKRAEARAALATEKPTRVDLISMNAGSEIDFEPGRLGLKARNSDL